MTRAATILGLMLIGCLGGLLTLAAVLETDLNAETPRPPVPDFKATTGCCPKNDCCFSCRCGCITSDSAPEPKTEKAKGGCACKE